MFPLIVPLRLTRLGFADSDIADIDTGSGRPLYTRSLRSSVGMGSRNYSRDLSRSIGSSRFGRSMGCCLNCSTGSDSCSSIRCMGIGCSRIGSTDCRTGSSRLILDSHCCIRIRCRSRFRSSYGYATR